MESIILPNAPAKIKEREKRKSGDATLFLNEIFSQYPIAQIAINLIRVKKSFDKFSDRKGIRSLNLAPMAIP